MLKRHYLFNPTQINNYNNFLKTLDNQSEEESKQMSSIKNTTLNKKEEINEFLKTADKTYISKQLFSPNFNGKNPKDIIIPRLSIKKPSRSNFILNENDATKISIHIEAEIHTIQDILKIIDTYKDEPTIQYNIDIKALHNIKEPLEELNAMIGMEELKKNIVDQILYFIQYLHKNKNSSGEFLHTVIYGPPGTGKTEIAKMMCKIYSKIGILSKGTFKKVTRSDLIAGYLGQTSLKTKEVINEALGGVLFIDEAYSLGNPDKRDSFAKECIDTLCEALSDNKDKLMVIIAGYEDELKENFFALNRGLDSRFVWRFETDKYNAEDMYHIFVKMVRDIGWEIGENSGITDLWFNKKKEYFMFFGRDIETLLTKTKIAHSKRVFTLSEKYKKKIILIDLEKGFEIFFKNGDSKKQREEKEFKKYIYNTLYS
jgi:SpoVK/Ycf46/Vps4 family AAA+-type ATPase